MKFEYECKDTDRECVAYISNLGLVYRDCDTCITIFDDGSGINGDTHWDEDTAIRKFYPGDKITITF